MGPEALEFFGSAGGGGNDPLFAQALSKSPKLSKSARKALFARRFKQPSQEICVKILKSAKSSFCTFRTFEFLVHFFARCAKSSQFFSKIFFEKIFSKIFFKNFFSKLFSKNFFKIFFLKNFLDFFTKCAKSSFAHFALLNFQYTFL